MEFHQTAGSTECGGISNCRSWSYQSVLQHLALNTESLGVESVVRVIANSRLLEAN